MVEASRCQAKACDLDPVVWRNKTDSNLVEADLIVARGADAHVSRKQRKGALCHRVTGTRQHERQREAQHADDQFRASPQRACHLLLTPLEHREVVAPRETPGPAHEQHDCAITLRPVQGPIERDQHRFRHDIGLVIIHSDRRYRTVEFVVYRTRVIHRERSLRRELLEVFVPRRLRGTRVAASAANDASCSTRVSLRGVVSS